MLDEKRSARLMDYRLRLLATLMFDQPAGERAMPSGAIITSASAMSAWLGRKRQRLGTDGKRRRPDFISPHAGNSEPWQDPLRGFPSGHTKRRP